MAEKLTFNLRPSAVLPNFFEFDQHLLIKLNEILKKIKNESIFVEINAISENN